MITDVTIIDVEGETQQTVETHGFQIDVEGTQRSPALVRMVEAENNGETSSVQDQCGHTERSRSGNNGWAITVEGFVTSGNGYPGELTLAHLRDTVAEMSEATIVTDIISGTYEVSNTMIGTPDDIVEIQTRDMNEFRQAFRFQLQLGESASE